MEKLAPIGLILLIGVLWRMIEPGNMPAVSMRQILNVLNLHLLIPAMVLLVMAESRINYEVLLVPLVACVVIGCCLGIALLAYGRKSGQITPATRGAMILAATYGNGIGIATPVIAALLGVELAWVPVLYTLLGSSPLVWTLGVWVAVRHSPLPGVGRLWMEMLRSPPLFAVLLGLLGNYLGWRYPPAIHAVLVSLSDAALPLIVFVVGLSLNAKSLGRVRSVLPALAIKSLLSPLLALLFAKAAGLDQATTAALVLTAASASFNVGISIADRYHLDTELYTLTIGCTTLAFVALSPIWYALSQ